MSKILRKTLAAFLFFSLASAAGAADEHGTAEEAVAMVHKVVAYMKENGKQKTIDEVNNIHGRFRDRDLYVTINTLQMVTLAHGANPRMQGKNLIDLRDADGKYFMKERMEILKTKDKGWQDYKFVNPVTQKIENKAMYFEKHGDVVINCGIYKG
ncbi:MAG TPA: cache domain-containing protein [Burkholderiaceae bacterium]|jgi:signal transduction histidine kinase